MAPLDRRVLPHLRPARAPLVGVLAGNVVQAVLVVVQAFATAALVATLLADPGTRAWVGPATWLVAATAGRAATGWLVDVAAAAAAGRVGRHLRHVVLRAALDLPATDLARRRTGELGVLATRGVAAVEPYLTRYLPTLALAAVLPVLTLLAIAVLDLWSALVVLLTLPLVPVFAVLVGHATRERADRQWRILGQLAGHFHDVVKGLPTLRAHRRAEAQVPRIRAVTDRYRRATVDTLRLAFVSSTALELVATISVALVAVLVGLRLAHGGMDLQTALTALLLAPEAYWPLRRVGAEFHAAAEGTATFEAIHELTTTDARTDPAPDAPLAGGHPRPLHLEGVTLVWPGRDRPAVEGLSATVPARGLTAVVGASGSGKSTLLQALLGELPLREGRVLVGEEDLARVDPEEWRARVAHVPQRPWLTGDSIAANLRVGRPGATEAELRSALATVHLLDLVESLPEGVHTALGEDGLGLSAGQRARLALARAVLSDRPYVLLDEPTAHLDEATEAVLLEVLRDLATRSTVLVVAHRPALVESATHVLTLPSPAESAPRTRRLGPSDPPTRPHGPAGSAPRDTAGAGSGTAPADSRPRRGQAALATLLGTLSTASGVALTATAGWLIARSAEQPPILMLTVAIVGVRAFGLARPVLRYAERLLSHDLALRLLAERRAQVYAALVPLVPGRLGRRGDLLGGIVDDVDALLDERLRVRMPLWTWAGVSLLVGLATWWALPAAVPVTLAVALGGGVLALLLGHAAARRAEQALVAARGDVSRRSLEVIDHARALVLWQRVDPALDLVDRAGDRLARAGSSSAAAMAAGRGAATLAGGLGVAGVAAVGAPALAASEVSGPMLALLLLLPLALVDVAAPLADAGALAVRTRAATARLRGLTATPPPVEEPQHPCALPDPPHDVDLAAVTAAWVPGRPALLPTSLRLAPGEHVGVRGPSGSGKSTLAALLVKFLAPTSGRYRLGGVDTTDLAGDDVRRVVGLLDDDPHIFGSSLLENVRLADPAADDRQVEQALRAAHLGDWIDSTPRGVEEILGDGGAALSGGERARVGIARALLADRPVLVLDEPTAHLDTPTARAVAEDLLETAGHRTLVWITHDRVGLDRMDRVLDLSVGSPTVVSGPDPVVPRYSRAGGVDTLEA